MYLAASGGWRRRPPAFQLMEETIGKPINIARIEQALNATDGGIIATTCPFCMTMLTDGVRSKEVQDKVQVLDIAELID